MTFTISAYVVSKGNYDAAVNLPQIFFLDLAAPIEITLVGADRFLDPAAPSSLSVIVGDDDQGPVTAVDFRFLTRQEGGQTASYGFARLDRANTADYLLIRIDAATGRLVPDAVPVADDYAAGDGFDPVPVGPLANAVPVAGDDAETTTRGTALVLAPSDLLDNDEDGDGDTLVIAAVANAENGTATLGPNGSVTFAPTPGFVGAARFEYTVSDGVGGEDVAVVSVGVSARPSETADLAISGDRGDNVLAGARGNDVINGDRGDDTLSGREGEDTISGGTGDDSVNGGDGADLLRGGVGEDTLNGGDGNDQLRGQSNADSMNGGDGNDNLKGGGGNDTLNGGDGNDFLNGGTRADLIDGGDGNDQLFGRSFDDTLIGGDGNDLLNAGGDDDRLEGGDGNDTLKGGGGSDVFVFDEDFGVDRLLDFDMAEDRLEITADLADGRNEAGIAALARAAGNGFEMDFGDGNVLRLIGLDSAVGLAGQIDIV